MRVAQQFENLCIARRLYLPRNRLPLPAERLCEPRMRHAEFSSEGNDVEPYRVRPYEVGRPAEKKRLASAWTRRVAHDKAAYAFDNDDFTTCPASVHHLLKRSGGEKTSTREVRLYSRYRRTRVPA